MGTEFGRQLQAQRNARGLTRHDIASAACPADYIALIEEGRREPTPEVIRELAGRLQLTPAQLDARDQTPSPEEAAYLLHSMAARQSHDLREYDSAAAHAAQAAHAAREAGKKGAWWDMTSLHAESLMKLRQFAKAAALARTLLAHPLGAAGPLTARAHDLLARSERGRGRIGAAVEHAREAVRAAATALPRTPVPLEPLRTLVESLADAGHLEEAWDYCGILADLAEDEPDGPLQGTAHAAIGNVAFLRGDHSGGATRHARAGRALSPANDIGLWAEFSKAAASARITGGDLGPETANALERAELAYSVIGGTREDQIELSLLRARWLYATGSPAQALALLRDVHAEKHLLAHHHAAHASLLLGRALGAAGQQEEADRVLDAAAHQLALAGIRPQT
ncbi:helix-turn-helix domain-containing protein [Sinomonas atrocyanea]|uniref:helix-turn-helix domain-containing protein n=1 Tax=Sinomonas atrocyanea TaxID=37927 RepID=UPI00277EE49E|nr:helix-turn-helix transcriptional regulator [Sinomonas atrocyanea]MDQ0259530.1 transcriptional regulator with XRE-family HTH domain [Sinomonas atrocyanea]MDR6623211.1 transcriptional regulator with XRE-family HTH domain [Sinomonas atrocyanea]